MVLLESKSQNCSRFGVVACMLVSRVRRHLIGPERRLIHQPPKRIQHQLFCCPDFFLPLLWTPGGRDEPPARRYDPRIRETPFGAFSVLGEVCLRFPPPSAPACIHYHPLALQSCQFSTKLLSPAADRPIIEHANKVVSFGTLQNNLEQLSSADGARMGHDMRSRSFQGDHENAALERGRRSLF